MVRRAKLSDEAGMALIGIGQVSQELADLITRAAWAQLQRRDTRWVYPVRSGKSDGYAHGIVQRAGIRIQPGQQSETLS